MLFFIDETWQKVAGQEIGALGAVGIPQDAYNSYCREMFAMKAKILGAKEVTDSEVKGQTCFSKAAFKRQTLHGDSYWLQAAAEVFDALDKYRARIFVVWTKNPTLLTLRNPASTALSKPYKQLFHDLRGYMRNEAMGQLATLNFDERGHREDEATARAVQNFLVRTRAPAQDRWDRYFLVIPSFTASTIGPGLQAADVISYLGAHRSDSTARPELEPFVKRMLSLRYEFRVGRKQRLVRCVRQVM